MTTVFKDYVKLIFSPFWSAYWLQNKYSLVWGIHLGGQWALPGLCGALDHDQSIGLSPAEGSHQSWQTTSGRWPFASSLTTQVISYHSNHLLLLCSHHLLPIRMISHRLCRGKPDQHFLDVISSISSTLCFLFYHLQHILYSVRMRQQSKFWPCTFPKDPPPTKRRGAQ